MLTSDKWAAWIGHGLSGLVILFMLFDGASSCFRSTSSSRRPLNSVPCQRGTRSRPRHSGTRLYGALRLPADPVVGDPADRLSRRDSRNAPARRQPSFGHMSLGLSRDHALGWPIPARRPLARAHSVSPLWSIPKFA